MAKKTIILSESQFNEICGTNTAYLDNPGDFTMDGTIHTRTDGAVSDTYGGHEDYSEPPTGDDVADSMTPETLWAMLFKNGGHGLWGHYGSGLRAGNLTESNSELEGRVWNGDSYTNLTTKKTQYKQMLDQLIKSGAPEQQIKRVKAAYMGVCSILNRETGAIKGRKTALKNLGMENQFQRAGGTKNSGNGKAHTRKKETDPNVGTGYITYK